MTSAKEEKIVHLSITLKSGAEFEIAGSKAGAIEFHKRFKKFVEGQIHKTDSHKLLKFEEHYFHAQAVAAYFCVDYTGALVNLGPAN